MIETTINWGQSYHRISRGGGSGYRNGQIYSPGFHQNWGRLMNMDWSEWSGFILEFVAQIDLS